MILFRYEILNITRSEWILSVCLHELRMWSSHHFALTLLSRGSEAAPLTTYKYSRNLSTPAHSALSAWIEKRERRMLKITTVVLLILCISLVRSRPRHRRSNQHAAETHFERIVRASCNNGQHSEILNCSTFFKNLPKIKNFKKSVYNYLESRLINLNKSQQVQVANALISKLFQLRRSLVNQVPRRNSEDMFARML